MDYFILFLSIFLLEFLETIPDIFSFCLEKNKHVCFLDSSQTPSTSGPQTSLFVE